MGLLKGSVKDLVSGKAFTPGPLGHCINSLLEFFSSHDQENFSLFMDAVPELQKLMMREVKRSYHFSLHHYVHRCWSQHLVD